MKASARMSAGSGGIGVRIGAILTAKSIVTAGNYGKHHKRSPLPATLRTMGGTAMHWAIRHLAVFVLDIQIVPLCCAAFESRA